MPVQSNARTTRPTTPLSNSTFMPYGCVSLFVRILLMIPWTRVSSSTRWPVPSSLLAGYMQPWHVCRIRDMSIVIPVTHPYRFKPLHLGSLYLNYSLHSMSPCMCCYKPLAKDYRASTIHQDCSAEWNERKRLGLCVRCRKKLGANGHPNSDCDAMFKGFPGSSI